MTPQHTKSVSRRTALAGLGVSGIALAAGGRTVTVAQDATMADHPMVGVWLVTTIEGPAPSFVMADGSFHHSSAPISAGPDGAISYNSPQNGVWEPDPDNERGIHFTSVQNIHDATGALTGILTVDGYPVATEDGQSFFDDGTRVRLTFRDASNTVTMVLGKMAPCPRSLATAWRPARPASRKARQRRVRRRHSQSAPGEAWSRAQQITARACAGRYLSSHFGWNVRRLR